MSEFCRGHTADGGECDCEVYSPPDEGLHRCAECGHGKSKHPIPTQPATIPIEKKGVLKLFQDMAKKSVPPFEQAKTETLHQRAPQSTGSKAAPQSTGSKTRRGKVKVRPFRFFACHNTHYVI